MNTVKNVLRNMIREDQRWNDCLTQFQEQPDWSGTHPAPGADLELEGFIPAEELELLKRLYLYGETYEELCKELGLKEHVGYADKKEQRKLPEKIFGK